MNTRWDVLGIGNAAVDDLVYLGSFPQPDTKIPVLEILRQGGGLTATALTAAARHRAQTAYCCALGSDELSIFTLAELEREGVDCTPVQRRDHASPYYSIILVDTSTGQRTILKQRGEMQPDITWITPEMITAAKVLLIDHLLPEAALLAAQIARAHAIPVVADIESPDFPGCEQLLPLINHLIIGEEVARRMTGLNQPAEMIQALAAPERDCLAITAGAAGVYFAVSGGLPRHIPALQVHAVDTTGCGDVFHGAYAAALARGESVEQAVALANVTAGIKATRPGGRLGIPDLQTARRALFPPEFCT